MCWPYFVSKMYTARNRVADKLWRFYAKILLFHNSFVWLSVISQIERNLYSLFIDIIGAISDPKHGSRHSKNYNRKLFFCHFYGVRLFTNAAHNDTTVFNGKTASKSVIFKALFSENQFHSSAQEIDWLLSICNMHTVNIL